MAKYTYPSSDISSLEALGQSFVSAGWSEDDVTFTLDSGDLTITTASVSKAVADACVVEVAVGSLFSNKTQRIMEVESRTAKLLGAGVDTWRVGSHVELSKSLTDNWITDHVYYSSHPEKISLLTPYFVPTLDGRGDMTVDISDIEILIDNAVERLQYLYVRAGNLDGSVGEINLIFMITMAADQEALDAITDTRT
jgi:hypothetical protein